MAGALVSGIAAFVATRKPNLAISMICIALIFKGNSGELLCALGLLCNAKHQMTEKEFPGERKERQG